MQKLYNASLHPIDSRTLLIKQYSPRSQVHNNAYNAKDVTTRASPHPIHNSQFLRGE